MKMKEYQEEAFGFAVYKDPMYPFFAVAEEAGEFVGVFAKAMRKGVPVNRDKALDELGDVLWNVAVAAQELHISLNDLAQLNLDKLTARKAESTLDLIER